MKQLRRRIARTMALGAAMAGLAIGVGTTPAHADAWSAHLEILHYNPYPYYWVAVDGHIPMSQWDAQGYINNGATVELRLYGADLGRWPDYHDLMYGPYFWGGGWGGGSGQLWADADGIHFFRTVLLPCNYLNEDGDFDELFVNAKFIDGDGASSNVNTNEIQGYYNCP